MLIQNQSYVRLDGGKNDYTFDGVTTSGMPLVMTKDGGALLAVTSNSFSDKDRIWLIKLNRAGSIAFSHRESIAGEALVTQALVSPVAAQPSDSVVRTKPLERALISEQTGYESSDHAP